MTTLSPELLARLRGSGISSRYLSDHLGIKIREAVALLQGAGAVIDNTGRYYLKGSRPPVTAFGRACTPSDHTGGTLCGGRDRV